MSEERTFADRLNEVMRKRNMTSGMLSIKTGISERMIRNYRKGTHEPYGYTLKMVAKGLRVSADWLLGLEDERNDP